MYFKVKDQSQSIVYYNRYTILDLGLNIYRAIKLSLVLKLNSPNVSHHNETHTHIRKLVANKYIFHVE